MRKGLVWAWIVFCFCPYYARADTPFPANCSVPVPDISGWEAIQASRVEFRLSDKTVAYLGVTVKYIEYRNPANVREFVEVVRRYIPLVSERQNLDELIISQTAIALSVRKEEEDRLNQLEKETDPILYVRWLTKENSRTGKDVKDGDVDIWFLQSSGECLVVQNEWVGVQFVTENVGNGKPRNILVGVKYQVGDAYHILKVDRRDDDVLTKGNR